MIFEFENNPIWNFLPRLSHFKKMKEILNSLTVTKIKVIAIVTEYNANKFSW